MHGLRATRVYHVRMHVHAVTTRATKLTCSSGRAWPWPPTTMLSFITLHVHACSIDHMIMKQQQQQQHSMLELRRRQCYAIKAVASHLHAS